VLKDRGLWFTVGYVSVVSVALIVSLVSVVLIMSVVSVGVIVSFNCCNMKHVDMKYKNRLPQICVI
jgi:hypothetical protein